MKVVLIRPPSVLGEVAKSSLEHPINLCGMASVLIGKGYKVKIWDYEVERLEKDTFLKRLEESQPTIIGISCMTPLIVNGHRIASMIKESFPEIVTVVGGVHPSSLPEQTLLEFPDFDIVVIGEGEETLLELCERIKNKSSIEGIPGIAYRVNGKVKREIPRQMLSNLDTLPYPARDLLNLNLYRHSSTLGLSSDFLSMTQLFTSRGCPGRCIFCASWQVFGNKIRFRSAQNVIEEVKECRTKYGFNHFLIMDDTFTVNPDRLYEICDGFKELGVSWDCDTRVNLVSKEMLKKMADSGCIKVGFGVESGSPRILKLIKKGITVEQIKNAFKWAKAVGLKTSGYFMVGNHPTETKEEIMMTSTLLKELKPDFITVAITTPFPNTELWTIMKEEGYLKDAKWEDFLYLQRPKWNIDYFTADELLKLQRKMLKSFYLDPTYILRILLNIKSYSELRYFLRAGIAFFKYIFKGR